MAGLRSAGVRVRDLLTREDGPIAARTRGNRWEMFLERFPDVGEMRVLDLGGTAASWRHAPIRPREVVLINPVAQPAVDGSITALIGDACAPPELGSFDLVYSNSLLDQVGGHWRRQRLADVVRDSAPRHWIQTPYRYFPVDPRWLIPLFGSLPVSARVWLTGKWPLGHRWTQDRRLGTELVLRVDMLSVAEMRFYFPDSELVRERLGPLTKSLIAVKS